jgi:hypothetical protein
MSLDLFVQLFCEQVTHCCPTSLQCIGEILSKHDLAQGKFRVEGVPEGAKSGIRITVRIDLGTVDEQL